MKAWIGKYNSQGGHKDPHDRLCVEFLAEHGPIIAHTLGFGYWEQVRLAVVCDVTGITLRRSVKDKAVKFKEKHETLRKYLPQPLPRINFWRSSIQIAGMQRLPEFGIDEVEAVRDEASHTIFIPLPPADQRKAVKGRKPLPRQEEVVDPGDIDVKEKPVVDLDQEIRAEEGSVPRMFTMEHLVDQGTELCYRYGSLLGDHGGAALYILKEKLGKSPPAALNVTIQGLIDD